MCNQFLIGVICVALASAQKDDLGLGDGVVIVQTSVHRNTTQACSDVEPSILTDAVRELQRAGHELSADAHLDFDRQRWARGFLKESHIFSCEDVKSFAITFKGTSTAFSFCSIEAVQMRCCATCSSTTPLEQEPVYNLDLLRNHEAPAQLSELLECFSAVMMNNGFDFYIVSGTLVGQVRDGALIPWDHDVDVEVNTLQYTQMRDAFCGSKWAEVKAPYPACANVSRFVAGGYHRMEGAPEDCHYCYSFVADETCSSTFDVIQLEHADMDRVTRAFHMDVSAQDFENPTVWTKEDAQNQYATSIENILPLKQCEISGVRTMCPAKPHTLLDIQYGSNWTEKPYRYDEHVGQWLRS